MPNSPEFNPAMPPGDPTALQKVLYAIGKFMAKPPGVARTTWDNATGDVTVQVSNRAGKNNTGRWVVLLFGCDPVGGSPDATIVPGTPSTGDLLSALPGGTSWLFVTDTSGLLEVNIGAGLAGTLVLFTMVLGEPTQTVA